MNEITINTANQTPIEIALGIDEEGMTTARKLYSFLELAQGQFSRWCKRNIIENDFAMENEDYVRLDINVETPTGGVIQREDYKLSASFAKKLSMQSKSVKGTSQTIFSQSRGQIKRNSSPPSTNDHPRTDSASSTGKRRTE